MSIHLSERLKRIADYIQTGSRVADVGTDHALLPIHLVESGQTRYVIATDVAPGPVQAATTNVMRHGCANQISVRCGNGLRTVEPGDVDTVVIAGMGGGTAVEILRNSPDVVSRVRRLVIQPMNASRQVRQFLLQTGFGLADECLFLDDRRYYEILVADDTLSVDEPYRAFTANDASKWLAIEFGPFILRRGGRVLEAYMKEQCDAMENMLRGLQHGKSEAAKVKQEQVQEHLDWIRQWLAKEGGNA